jgi:hypothetical protein
VPASKLLSCPVLASMEPGASRAAFVVTSPHYKFTVLHRDPRLCVTGKYWEGLQGSWQVTEKFESQDTCQLADH